MLDEQHPEAVWRWRWPLAGAVGAGPGAAPGAGGGEGTGGGSGAGVGAAGGPAAGSGGSGAGSAGGSTRPLRLLARTSWEDPQGVVHPGDEVEVTGDDFTALGPYRDLLEVSVQPVADWERLSQALAELRYRDGDHFVERRLRFDAQADAPETVRFPLLDPTHRSYDWRQTLFRVDGTVAETDWRETDKTVLIVGVEPEGPREVRIVWVGDPGPALGLRVDLWPRTDGGAEGEMVSTFLRAGETEGRIALPPAAGPLAYRYRVARFTAAGEEPVKDGTATGSLLVVQTGG
jgi:hypothetical protein